MCANMSKDELTPMVFSEWPSEYRSDISLNMTKWPFGYNLTTPHALIHTVVDDLFGFDDNETHPIFFHLPRPFDTELNVPVNNSQQSIYLLAASVDGIYTMCSMRVAQSPECFTEYNTSMSGDSLTSYCGDHPVIYSKSHPEAPKGFWNKDWLSVALVWGLGLGLEDPYNAIDGLLTQLIPTTKALDPGLPSISEALAVLAGCTLVLSSLDSPFIHCKKIPENFTFTIQDCFQIHEICNESNSSCYHLSFPSCFDNKSFSVSGLLTWSCPRLELLRHKSDPRHSAVPRVQRHAQSTTVHVRWPASLAEDILCRAWSGLCLKRLLPGVLCNQWQPPHRLYRATKSVRAFLELAT